MPFREGRRGAESQLVGWTERSEYHRLMHRGAMGNFGLRVGLVSLVPPYKTRRTYKLVLSVLRLRSLAPRDGQQGADNRWVCVVA